MEELVALVFAFCEPNTRNLDQEIACQAYITNCVVDGKDHWNKKILAACEQDGLRTNWRTYSEAD